MANSSTSDKKKYLELNGLKLFAGKVKERDIISSEQFITNVTCGSIQAGTIIDPSTLVKDVVMKMLVIKKYATYKKPTLTLGNTGTPDDKSYEVGTKIEPILSSTYTDGVLYSYTTASVTTAINAGCAEGTTTYCKSTDTGKTWTAYAKNESFGITLGTTYLKAITSYAESTETAKDSDLTPSSTKINAGELTSNYITYTGKYGYFYNTFDTDNTPSEYTRDNLGSPILINSTATNYTINLNNNKCVLAVPPGHSITETVYASNNEPQYYDTSICTIKDAGGNDVTYTLYIFSYSKTGGLGLTATCKF